MIKVDGFILFSTRKFRNGLLFCFREFCGAKWSREKKVLPTTFIDIYKCIRDICVIISLGGGFKYFLFSPLLGEMIQFH